jgi:hypothetical protein
VDRRCIKHLHCRAEGFNCLRRPLPLARYLDLIAYICAVTEVSWAPVLQSGGILATKFEMAWAPLLLIVSTRS